MIFWVILAILAALASLSVLIPLYRTRQIERRLAGQEVSVYRDQLREIERDVERGVIPKSEAEAARTEIARRLIKADASKSDGALDAASKRPRQIAALLAVVGMPLLAVGLYLFVGSPNLPDDPLEARLTAPPEKSDTAALIARVEDHLAAHPDDGQGWAVLAPSMFALAAMRTRSRHTATPSGCSAARPSGRLRSARRLCRPIRAL